MGCSNSQAIAAGRVTRGKIHGSSIARTTGPGALLLNMGPTPRKRVYFA